MKRFFVTFALCFAWVICFSQQPKTFNLGIISYTLDIGCLPDTVGIYAAVYISNNSNEDLMTVTDAIRHKCLRVTLPFAAIPSKNHQDFGRWFLILKPSDFWFEYKEYYISFGYLDEVIVIRKDDVPQIVKILTRNAQDKEDRRLQILTSI